MRFGDDLTFTDNNGEKHTCRLDALVAGGPDADKGIYRCKCGYRYASATPVSGGHGGTRTPS